MGAMRFEPGRPVGDEYRNRWAAALLALMLTGHAWAPTAMVVGADPTKIVLKGTLVTPDQVIDGELVIDGDTITCVAVTCESPTGGDANHRHKRVCLPWFSLTRTIV